MKLRFTTKNRQITFEVEGDSPKDLFREIAATQEIFDIHECGACHGADIQFRVRESKNQAGKAVEYFELQCRNHECRARLTFGQNMDQKNLFPRRKDASGNWIENNGWEIYRPAAGAARGNAGTQQGQPNDPWES